MPLSPLTVAEAEELAQLKLGQMRTEAATKLADTAGGNPLFIEQLAATMAESSAAGGSMPTTIRGILSARLDALPAAERALLLDAAVVVSSIVRRDRRPTSGISLSVTSNFRRIRYLGT